MNNLRVFLFGKFQVESDEQVLPGFDSSKVQELFSYLLLYRACSHSRETLADLLWGEIPTPQSKKYLRQTLWQLKIALDSYPTDDYMLLVEPDQVRLNPMVGLWLDVALFEQAYSLVQGVPGRQLDIEHIQTLQGAVGLYQGDLLEGWYQDWCLFERERLQNIYLAMLDKLVDYCETHRKYETGLLYGRRALYLDRARERTHRQLMRLQYLAGDRTTALRQYEKCVTILEKELGVRPARRTVALYEQIRADNLDSPTLMLVKAGTSLSTTIASLPEMLNSLKQLQEILDNAQRQVQQNIQTVEQFLQERP